MSFFRKRKAKIFEEVSSRTTRIMNLATGKAEEDEAESDFVTPDDLSSELSSEQLITVEKIEDILEEDNPDYSITELTNMRIPAEFNTAPHTSQDVSRNIFDSFEDCHDSDKDKDYSPESSFSSTDEEDNFICRKVAKFTPRKQKTLTISQLNHDRASKEQNTPCFTDTHLSSLENSKPREEFSNVTTSECIETTLRNAFVDETNQNSNGMKDISDTDSDINVTFRVPVFHAQKRNNNKSIGREAEKKIVKRNKDGVFTRKKRADRTINRNSGKEYVNSKGNVVPARKSKQLLDCRIGCKRKLEVPCRGGVKTVREVIFDEYWALQSHDKRVAYVCSLVDTCAPKRSRKRTDDKNSEKAKKFSHIFHFQISGERFKVCKNCFIMTLNETSSFIFLALKNKNKTVSGTITPDSRGKHVPANKHSEEKINAVIEHIKSIPKYQSHYTRRVSERWYLPAHLNLQLLYEAYKEGKEAPVSRDVYENEFHKLNISFKTPKIDTCHKCGVLKIRISSETDENKLKELKTEQELHHKQADFAYEKKNEDKQRSKVNMESERCYMFDLQQCLPTPCLTENVVFYKRQLWTFNLTIHDATTGKVFCYMWHEAEGGRGGNQIATCIYKQLMSLPSNIKHVTLYSDTCLGQNKNSHVAAMFLKAMEDNKNLETVDHKFMVSGHSHIECDVDHGMISKQKKFLEVPVYGPQDWYQLVRSTGPKNKKFTVHEVTHQDFLDFSYLLKGPLQLRKKNSEGDRFSWLDARWFRYTRKYGTVYYKNNLNEEDPFMELSFIRRGFLDAPLETKKCYKDTLVINHKKKKDLLDILELLPPSYHSFYNSLKSSDKVPDVLLDIEECAEDNEERN